MRLVARRRRTAERARVAWRHGRCCASPTGSSPAGRLPGGSATADRPVVSLVRLHGVITPIAGPGAPLGDQRRDAREKVLERAFAPERARRRRAAGQLAGRLAHAVGARRRPHPRAGRRARGAGARLLRGRRGVRRLLARLRGRRDLRAPHVDRRLDRRDQPELRARGAARSGSACERRLYTAGTSKSRLDPFLPEKPEDVAVAARAAGPAARDVPRLGRGAARRPARDGRRAVQRRGVDRRPGAASWAWSTASAPRAGCSPSASPTPSWCRSRGADRCSPGSASARLPRRSRSRSCAGARPGG